MLVRLLICGWVSDVSDIGVGGRLAFGLVLSDRGDQGGLWGLREGYGKSGVLR